MEIGSRGRQDTSKLPLHPESPPAQGEQPSGLRSGASLAPAPVGVTLDAETQNQTPGEQPEDVEKKIDWTADVTGWSQKGHVFYLDVKYNDYMSLPSVVHALKDFEGIVAFTKDHKLSRQQIRIFKESEDGLQRNERAEIYFSSNDQELSLIHI